MCRQHSTGDAATHLVHSYLKCYATSFLIFNIPKQEIHTGLAALRKVTLFRHTFVYVSLLQATVQSSIWAEVCMVPVPCCSSME